MSFDTIVDGRRTLGETNITWALVRAKYTTIYKDIDNFVNKFPGREVIYKQFKKFNKTNRSFMGRINTNILLNYYWKMETQESKHDIKSATPYTIPVFSTV